MNLFDRLHDFLGALGVNEAVLMSWNVMVILIVLGLMVRRRLGHPGLEKLQSLFEMFMEGLCDLIREIVRSDPGPYVPLAATLFLFVFTSNLLGMVPGLSSPTGDLGVTAALATLVFLAVPVYGVRKRGFGRYMRTYIQPTPFMLPLNVLSEVTRTLALAVRLFGNIMSGQYLFLIVVGVITTLLRGYGTVFMPAGYVLTLFLSVLSLITAVIQAYIFTVLALVYIGAAVKSGAAKGPSKEASA